MSDGTMSIGSESNQQSIKVGFCPFCGSSDVIVYSGETNGQEGVECPECKRICNVQAKNHRDEWFDEDHLPEPKEVTSVDNLDLHSIVGEDKPKPYDN